MADQLTQHIDDLSARAFQQADRSTRNADALGRITNVITGLHVIAAAVFVIAGIGAFANDDAGAATSLLVVGLGLLVYAFVIWAFLSAIQNVVGNGASSLELQAFDFAARWAEDDEDDDDPQP
ncbi:MAG: hypothetical protein O2815_10935 [Actinomycetota bacterium]|nr:hypothetical protein [Actinomycetota bacterium]